MTTYTFRVEDPSQETIDRLTALAAETPDAELIISKPQSDLFKLFDTQVKTLPFPTRPRSIMRDNNIIYLGSLVHIRNAELLRLPNCGTKSKEDIDKVLTSLGLHRGMDMQGWQPPELRAKPDLLRALNTPLEECNLPKALEHKLQKYFVSEDCLPLLGGIAMLVPGWYKEYYNLTDDDLTLLSDVLARFNLTFNMDKTQTLGWLNTHPPI